MLHSARRRMSRLAATSVACLALLASGLQLVTATPAAAATSQTYSDPIWFPVRDHVQIACVGDHNQRGNNNDATAHGRCDRDHVHYFAMNIDAGWHMNPHPTIWAAGAGIVQDVINQPTCGGSSSIGKVVRIDHGGGVVSVYEHLQSINVRVGQHVTPSTALGTMGHSGLPCSATGNYLDFQIRDNGGNYQNADTTTIRTLLGCNGTRAVVWPAGLGLPYKTWTQVPYMTHVDTSGGHCYPTRAGNSPATPSRPAARAGTTSVTLSWRAVSGANRYMVQAEIYGGPTGWLPVCNPYHVSGCTAGYTAVSGTATRAAISRLPSARKFRLRLSAHNRNGWSPATGWVYATTRA